MIQSSQRLAKVIVLPVMPMIEGVTFTTAITYVKNHKDRVRSLILALVDAIHFYKIRKTDTLVIIKKQCSDLLRIDDDEEWNCFYESQAAFLETKAYPSLEAIRNVFAVAVKRDPETQKFNPLILWDLHYLKEIDDSGYI